MEKMCAHLPDTVQAEKSCGVLTYLCLALQLRASPTLGSHVSKPQGHINNAQDYSEINF